MKRHLAATFAGVTCSLFCSPPEVFAQSTGVVESQRFRCEDGWEGQPKLSWSHDGNYAAADGFDVTCLIDLQSGGLSRRERENFIFWRPGTQQFLAVRGWFSRRGTPTLVVVDAKTGRTLAKRVEAARAKVTLDYSSDGKYLLHGNRLGDLDIWNAETLESVEGAQLAHGPDCTSVAAAWQPGTHRLVVTSHCREPKSRYYKRLVIMDADTGSVLHAENFFQPEEPMAGSLDWPEWSPDGSSFAWGTTDGNVLVLSAQGDHLINVEASDLARLYWNPDGNYLALMGLDRITIADVSAGSILRSIAPEVATSLDFQWLDADTALARPDDQGHVWAVNVRDGARKLILTTEARDFNKLTLSADKCYIAVSNGLELGIQVLRVSDGVEVLRDKEASSNVQWAPDSRSLSYTINYEIVVTALPAN